MRICTNCGASNEDNRNTCLVCGATLEGVLKKSKDAVSPELQQYRKTLPKRWPLLFILLAIPLVYLLEPLSRFMYLEVTHDRAWALFHDNFVPGLFYTVLVAAPITFFVLFIVATRKRKRLESLWHAERFSVGAVESSLEETETAAPAEEQVAPEAEMVFAPTASSDAPIEQHASMYEALARIDEAYARSPIPDYKDDTTYSILAEELCGFAASRGLRMDASTAASLLAAMTASRLIFVKDKNPEIAEKTVMALAAFFGTEAHASSVTKDIVNTMELHIKRAEGSSFVTESSFLCDVYQANHRTDSLYMTMLTGVRMDRLSNYFAPYLDYAVHPERKLWVRGVPTSNSERYLKYIQYGALQLPSNLWFFLRTEKNIVVVPESAMIVDLTTVTSTTPTTSPVSHMPISKNGFADLFRTQKDLKFIPEEYFKKIDALEIYIASKRPDYRFGNKASRTVEAYATAALSCGMEPLEVVDRAVAYKMLPELLNVDRETLTGKEGGIVSAMDRIFGLENIPVSVDMMKQMGFV